MRGVYRLPRKHPIWARYVTHIEIMTQFLCHEFPYSPLGVYPLIRSLGNSVFIPEIKCSILHQRLKFQQTSQRSAQLSLIDRSNSQVYTV